MSLLNKVFLFTTLLELLVLPAFATVGLTDWVAATPNGNRINELDNLELVLADGKQIEGLDQWYFYKDHVIGKYDTGEKEGYL